MDTPETPTNLLHAQMARLVPESEDLHSDHQDRYKAQLHKDPVDKHYQIPHHLQPIVLFSPLNNPIAPINLNAKVERQQSAEERNLMRTVSGEPQNVGSFGIASHSILMSDMKLSVTTIKQNDFISRLADIISKALHSPSESVVHAFTISVTSLFKLIELPKGATLFQQGEYDDNILYLVAHGTLDMMRFQPALFSRRGTLLRKESKYPEKTGVRGFGQLLICDDSDPDQDEDDAREAVKLEAGSMWIKAVTTLAICKASQPCAPSSRAHECSAVASRPTRVYSLSRHALWSVITVALTANTNSHANKGVDNQKDDEVKSIDRDIRVEGLEVRQDVRSAHSDAAVNESRAQCDQNASQYGHNANLVEPRCSNASILVRVDDSNASVAGRVDNADDCTQAARIYVPLSPANVINIPEVLANDPHVDGSGGDQRSENNDERPPLAAMVCVDEQHPLRLSLPLFTESSSSAASSSSSAASSSSSSAASSSSSSSLLLSLSLSPSSPALLSSSSSSSDLLSTASLFSPSLSSSSYSYDDPPPTPCSDIPDNPPNIPLSQPTVTDPFVDCVIPDDCVIPNDCAIPGEQSNDVVVVSNKESVAESISKFNLYPLAKLGCGLFGDVFLVAELHHGKDNEDHTNSSLDDPMLSQSHVSLFSSSSFMSSSSSLLSFSSDDSQNANDDNNDHNHNDHKNSFESKEGGQPKQVYPHALKIMPRARLLELGSGAYAVREKKIWMELGRHPFMVELRGTFKDAHNLYFLMEPVLGGELTAIMESKGGYIDEGAGRFYGAQLVLALEHIHGRGVVYRDLKPENILLDRAGYIKLVDFGLSKKLTPDTAAADADNAKQPQEKTYTICGSPAYMAPEIFYGQGYISAVDWWSLGALLFELMSGCSPYELNDEDSEDGYGGDDAMATFNRMSRVRVEYPKHFSVPLRDFLKQLLQVRPNNRLGERNGGGATDVKRHAWWSNVDWEAILNKTVAAPYQRPATNGDDCDVSYFASTQDKQAPLEVNKQHKQNDQSDPQNWDHEF